MAPKQTRRTVVKSILAGAAAITTSGGLFLQQACGTETPQKLKGNINHAVCRWTFNQLSLDELCIVAKNIGIKAIDLVGPKDWPTLQNHGIDSSMCNGAEISL